MSYQTIKVELTRNDIKLLKRSLSMYRKRKASITSKEFNICKSLWNYLDKHQKEEPRVESCLLGK